MKTEAQDYSWFNDLSISEAGCVTVVPAADRAAALAAFGAQPETGQPVASVEDAYSAFDRMPSSWVYVVEVGDALVVMEDNGFQGTRPEVLGPVSRASATHKAAAFFWNVNAVTAFSAAKRGKVQWSVELLGAEPEDLEGVPRSLHRLVLDGGSEEGDMLGAGGALVAAYTDVALSASALQGGMLYEIVPPSSALETYLPGYPDPALEPDVVEAITSLPPAVQRQLAEWVTLATVREAGVENEAAVRNVLAALGTGVPPALTSSLDALARRTTKLADEFTRLAEDLEMGGAAIPEHPFYQVSTPGEFGRTAISHLEGLYLWQRSLAVEATRYVTHADPLSAALGCLARADRTFANGRTTRGWQFEEDGGGRRRADHEPNPRHLTFRDAVSALLAELTSAQGGRDDAWERASAALPSPLSARQRVEAVQADAEAALAGDFDTYQLIPAGEPDEEDGRWSGEEHFDQAVLITFDEDDLFADAPIEMLVEHLKHLEASLAIATAPQQLIDVVRGSESVDACILALQETFGLDDGQAMMALHSPIVHLTEFGLADLRAQRDQVAAALAAHEERG